MKISSVHAALRDATASRHESLEIDADLEARLRDPARRAAAVAGLLAFHRQVRDVTAPFAGALAPIGVDADRRVTELGLGLLVLQGQTGDLRPVAPARDLSTALGWAYVAEGSALGGRVMRKAMIRDAVDLTGLDFLDPHGDRTGPRWIAFLDLLNGAVGDGRADQVAVVAAAVAAFDQARAALVPMPKESRAA